MPNRRHRLLLLNPPAEKPVFRDCYCSGPSKGAFFIHPLDLQIQSGFFPTEDFQLEFVDAVFDGLNPIETFGKIKAFGPDTILSLVGQAFLEDDVFFFNTLKSSFPHIRLFLSGDTVRFTPWLPFKKVPELDGLLMDFGSPGLLKHLKGEVSPDLLIRPESGSFESIPQAGFEYPLPSADVASKYVYRLPFFEAPKYYSIAASFGCPFRCSYCNTHLLGYRTRSVEDFIQELYYASALGFKSLYIRDATFLFDRQRALKLLGAWEKTGLKFQWICFTRPDLIDRELAEIAARLGCCLMMLGVESFDESCLNDVSRSMGLEDIENAFHSLRKAGIRSAAQIIVGMHNIDRIPDENSNRSDIYEKRLKNFLKSIDPDYVSFNVFYPRPGVNIENPVLRKLCSGADIYRIMADRLNRYFYYHLRSIVRQISSIKSCKQLAFQVKIATHLFLDR